MVLCGCCSAQQPGLESQLQDGMKLREHYFVALWAWPCSTPGRAMLLSQVKAVIFPGKILWYTVVVVVLNNRVVVEVSCESQRNVLGTLLFLW